jgi:hypothetical protein
MIGRTHPEANLKIVSSLPPGDGADLVIKMRAATRAYESGVRLGPA